MTEKIKSKLTTAERDDWVAALRSGEYKQFRGGWGFGFNEGPGAGFCCLNVLCHRLTGHSVHDDINDNDMDRSNMVIDKVGRSSVFVLMNDEAKKSFDEIADYIMEKVDTIDG